MKWSITALGYHKNAVAIPSRAQPSLAGVWAIGRITPTAGRLRSEECRVQAAECLEIASHWSDLIKDQYVELARQWQMLAVRAEKPFG